MTHITSKKIEAASCCLHCLEAGDGEKQSVLLLHGMKFNARTWEQLGTLNQLSQAGFHASAIDMPGFGESPVCEAEPDKILSDFIAQSELDKPILIGPSMGGRIALEFALNHPGILGALILVGAVGVEENKERLAELRLPLLLLWGGDDQISPLTNSETLLTEVDGAQRVVFEGAPHPCYLEQPDAWHKAVLSFLEGL